MADTTPKVSSKRDEKQPLLKSSGPKLSVSETVPNGSNDAKIDVSKKSATSSSSSSSDAASISTGRRGRPYRFFSNVKWYEYFILLLAVGAALVQGMMPLAFYFYFGKLVDENDDSDLPDKIRETSLYFFGIAIVGGIAAWANNALFLFVGERISARVRHRLFQAITMQDVAFFDTTKTGMLITRLSEDSVTIRGLFSEKLSGLFTGLCQCFGGLGFAFYYSWSMTLVMLGTAPIMGIAIGLQGKLTVHFTKKTSDTSTGAVSVAEEVITNFRTVKSFANEAKEVSRFNTALSDILGIAYKKALMQGFSLGFTTTCIWGAAALAFFYGGWLVSRGDLKLGELITVFGMMLFAVVGLSMGLSMLPEVFKTKASFGLISEIVERVPDINYCGGNVVATGIKGNVKFDNVTFKYPTRDINVLQGLSFDVKPGQTVALVGESGSGKSTIFGLIERFYDPEHGGVYVDGHDIREFDPHWYHSHVALVSQEPILFSGTIAENIRYAKEFATEQEVIEAARAANAHDFIVGLPEGYNTKVGERGVALSGGQKQRVAIARAMLKDPRILLLDEATSALDAESEHLVQQALDKLMVGRTSFIIAHRLSTVRDADVIFVLRKGTIVETGRHDELIEAGGAYFKLAQRQMRTAETDSEEDETEVLARKNSQDENKKLKEAEEEDIDLDADSTPRTDS